MPKKIPTEEEKRRALDKAKREFPGNKTLQEIHYIRYLLEIEWSNMSFLVYSQSSPFANF